MQSATARNPRAAALAADEPFSLFPGIGARDGLLELSQGVDELLNQSEVRAQPPEQQDQQESYQGDN